MSGSATSTDAQGTELAPTPMWSPDDESGDVVEDATVDDGAEQTGEEAGGEATVTTAEAAGEATGEATTGDDGEGQGTGEGEQKPHSWDKGLQQLSQRHTALEQKLEQSIEQITNLLNERLTQQPGTQQGDTATAGETGSTPAGEQAATEAMLDAEQLLQDIGLADAEDYDTITVEQFKQVVGKLAKAQRHRGVDPATKQLLEALQGQVKNLEGQLQQTSTTAQSVAQQAHANRYWSQFKADNGFDGQDKWAEIQATVVDEYDGLTPEQVHYIARDRFNSWVKQEKATASAPGNPGKPGKPGAAKPAQTGPGKNPPRSTTGTQTVTPGASASRPANPGGKSKPPMYVPDDDD